MFYNILILLYTTLSYIYCYILEKNLNSVSIFAGLNSNFPYFTKPPFSSSLCDNAFSFAIYDRKLYLAQRE